MTSAEPIFHLSLSCADRAATERFYTDLGAEIGRRRGDWINVWLFGAQITFHEWPDKVPPAPYDEGLHFGATLPMPRWQSLAADLSGASFERAPRYDPETGTAKMYLRDPNGYVVELKAYDDPGAALERPELASRQGT